VKPLPDGFHADDENKKENLTVEAWLADIAAYPAVDAEVDERREGPDFLFLNEFSVEAGGDGNGHKKGQGQIFAVKHGRQREHRGAGDCR
jgi:hypothetical protein